MELLLNGYLTKDDDDHPSLIEAATLRQCFAKSIPREIQYKFGKKSYDR